MIKKVLALLCYWTSSAASTFTLMICRTFQTIMKAIPAAATAIRDKVFRHL